MTALEDRDVGERLDGASLHLELSRWAADISVLAARTAHRGIVAGLEATQTGINRLSDVQPAYPLLNGDHVQGLADIARALGGDVVIADLDPVRRLTAQHGGWRTGDLDELLPTADVVATATARST